MTVHGRSALILGVILASVLASTAKALDWSDVPKAIQQRIDTFDRLPELDQAIRNIPLARDVREKVSALYNRMLSLMAPNAPFRARFADI